MTTATSPTPRWPLALGAVVVVACLIGLLTLLARDHTTSRTVASASASAPAVPRGVVRVPVAERPRASIAGRVVDPAGQPVPAATVCAFVVPSTLTTTAEIRAPRCVMGGSNGSYLLPDLPSGTTLSLSAAAASFLPQAYAGEGGTLRLTDGEQRTGVDFAMRGGGVQIRGRVADATGGVVPGALVASDVDEGEARAIATADEKGEFSLWVVPGPVSLAASATGYAPGRARGPAPGHFFSIYMVPGSTLVGRAVIAGTDTPVAAARIEAIQVEGGGSRASTSTGGDGHFRVEGLSPGRYRIEATSEGREGYSPSSITLGMGETSPETVVELDPAYVVKGRVLVKGTGAPCMKGNVRITDHKQEEFSQGTIEPDGGIRMASVIPGNYEVEVTCEGHISQEKYPPVLVVDHDVAPPTWEVESGASVRVTVVDPAGKPIAGATVTASMMQEGERSRSMTEHAEPDGTFLVRGLKPGTFTVSVNTSDGGHGEQENVIVDAQREARARVEIPFAGAIEGVVQDLDHHPVAGVSVVAAGPRRRGLRTSDDGTFLLTGLPPGEYELTAQDPTRGRNAGEEDDHKTPVKVTVAAPGRAHATLTLDKRLGAIAGRVVDSDGQPITDAFIDHAPVDGGLGRRRSSGPPVVTDTEGHFTIEGLVEGEYNLRAYRKGGGEGKAENIKVGTRNVALRIGQGASLAGTLMSPKGPIERFSLSARDEKTMFSRMEMFFHARGAFALRDLPPGTYEISADTPEGTATTKVTLAEGEQKTGIALVMAMRGTVDGRLLLTDGNRPLAGLHVRVIGEGSTSPMNGEDGVSLADGRFHLENILSGSWKLQIAPNGSTEVGYTTLPVEINPSGATDLGDLHLEKRAPPPPSEDSKD